MLNRLISLEKRMRRIELMVGFTIFLVGTQHPGFIAMLQAFMKAISMAGVAFAAEHHH